jgi:hypothetical protein
LRRVLVLVDTCQLHLLDRRWNRQKLERPPFAGAVFFFQTLLLISVSVWRGSTRVTRLNSTRSDSS